MLRIQLSKPKTNQPETPRSQSDFYAIRYGLITAVIVVIYNLIVQLSGDGGFELAHIGIFVILFLMIGYGMNKNRKWIRDDHAFGRSDAVWTCNVHCNSIGDYCFKWFAGTGQLSSSR